MDKDNLENFLEKLKRYEEELENSENDENFDESFISEVDSTLTELSEFIMDKKREEFSKLNVKFINKSNNPDPSFANEGDSGFDLRAFIQEEIVVGPMDRVLVPTGLFFELEKGFEIQVRPRSGLAIKNGITVLNTPGTVDSHYRGEIKIILMNLGKETFTIKNGDRIAQAVICPVYGEGKVFLSSSEILNETKRNADGFGSTGV